MATPNAITTGEQSCSSTGAITGTLTTATLSKTGTIYLRIRGLTSGQSIRIALEDTANVTPFSDVTTCWIFDTVGGPSPEGITKSIEVINLPSMRFGVTNSALRFNATTLGGSPTALVDGWLDQ